MVKTLDARTSQGSNGQQILTPSFTNGVPLLFAQVGLQISNPGMSIRTFFRGSSKLQQVSCQLTEILLSKYTED